MPARARVRYLLFALACAALVAAGLWFMLREPGGGDPGVGSDGKEPLPPALDPAEREHLERLHAQQQASGEDVHVDEAVPAPAIERAADRFLTAYLPYEVGEGGPAIEETLRATATPEFAEQLLASGPRFPPGLKHLPREAELLAIDVIPLGEDHARIVAKLRRGGDLEAAAFELRQLRRRWLVAGVAG